MRTVAFAMFIVLTAVCLPVAPVFALDLSGWKAEVLDLLEDFQYDQALTQLEAHADAAGDAEFLYLRGRVFTILGRFTEAKADLEKAISINGNFAEAVAQLALVNAWLGKMDKAKELIKQAMSLSDSPEIHFINGRVLTADGDLEEAMTELDAAINQEENARYLVARGIVFRHVGSRESQNKAMADFTRAIQLKPNCHTAYLERSAVYVLRGDPVGAKSDINKAIKLAPNYFGGYLRRGYIYQQRGEPEQALADFTRAAELAPEVIEGPYARAELLLSMGRMKQAEKVIREAMKLRPNEPDFWVLLHYALAGQNRIDESLQAITKVIELAPDDWRGYNMRGQLLMSQKKLDEAIADFNRAEQKNPKRLEPKLNKVVILMSQKKTQEALKIVNAILQEHPENLVALQTRMSIYEQMGRAADALADLERIEKIKKKRESQ